MTDAIDELEKSKQQIGGGGDYASWWNSENFDVSEGDKVIGPVVEKHAYTDPGGEDHPIATVVSIGTGSLDKGTHVSTPTRKGIEDFAEDASVGQFVLIEYTGMVDTNSGRSMHTYSASKLTQDDWKETEQSDVIQEVWNASRFSAGGTDEVSTSSDGLDDDALEFAVDVLAMNDGDVTVDELDEYLNDIRDYDVDVDEVIEEVDELEEDDGVVTT